MADCEVQQSATTDKVPARVVSRGTQNADSIEVAGFINGKSQNFVVDSGSNCTLLRTDVLNRTDLPVMKEGLCDVTGRRSALRGPIEVQLEIGGQVSKQEVYVADEIEEPCILGLDYMTANRCILDFDKRTMQVRDALVPFVVGPSKGGAPRAFRVKVQEQLTLKPETETLVSCRTDGDVLRVPGMVEAHPDLPAGVMVGRTLVDAERSSFHVLMANLSDKPVQLHRDTFVGMCEPVEVMEASTVEENVDRSDKKHLPKHVQELMEGASADLTGGEREQVRGLLAEFADVFSSSDQDLGKTSLTEHHINTGNHPPVKVPPRRIPVPKREEATKMIEEMDKQGLIERSHSPWSSALVLVRKKDGSLRCCVDYRALNEATVKDSYPLPRIDDTLDALVGAKWFTTLDLKAGYHQIGMAEEDMAKTAFSCGGGLWQWRVMPFGLCNSPATFERLMERVLSGLHWKTLMVYLDDVIVFGKTFEEELQRLREVLQRMRDANLKLNPKKCRLFKKEVEYLGHIVSRHGVRTDPGKTSTVKNWPTPKNRKELRSFLGLCSYYRKFVRGYATIAAPLHALTKEKQNYMWDEACDQAFKQLKTALTSAPILRYPDPEREFVVDTDASNHGIGAVLSQVEDGQERVVAYYSRSLTAPEKNYCVTRKELLAVVEAVRHFHHYLYGTSFIIRTDHSALQWLKTLKDPEGQLARWLARLGQYDFKIYHRPGAKHLNADSLSRRPCDQDCKHCQRKEPVQELHCRAAETTDPQRDSDSRSEDSVQVMQRSDDDLAPIITYKEQGEGKPHWEEVTSAGAVTKRYWAQWETLRVQNGILQRCWESTDGKSRRWLIVVPSKMREEVMTEMHGSVTGGHFGIKKTLMRLRARFYWIGMRRDVSEWCRVCEACASKKGPQSTPQAPLQIRNAGAPMERIAIDITGPLRMSSSGNRYILVVMDYFTKWPEAYPIPNQEATTVARVLVDEFFCRFGVPYELHSDQGRNFESKVFQECCNLLGIRKTRTTPLHPESDGMVERFNRTLGQELAKRCRDSQDDWDVNLPTILMSYRSAEHESTGYTPAQLMLGRDLRLPVDLMMPSPPEQEPETTTHYVMALRERLREAHVQARSQLNMTSQSMKLHKDVRANTELLVAGDRVWFYNPKRKKGLSPKLMSPWEGPYEVVQRMSSVTYRIQRKKGSALKVVHYNRLWKIRGQPHFSWRNKEEGTAQDDADKRQKGAEPNVAVAGKEQTKEKGTEELSMGSNPVQGNAHLQKETHPTRREQSEAVALPAHVEGLAQRRESRRDRRQPDRFGELVCHRCQV